jgi:hypothetical protein
MNPPFALYPRDHESGTASATEPRFSPAVYALDQLFPNRRNAPYSADDRLVVLVIVRALSSDGSFGRIQLLSQLSKDRKAVWQQHRHSQVSAANAL